MTGEWADGVRIEAREEGPGSPLLDVCVGKCEGGCILDMVKGEFEPRDGPGAKGLTSSGYGDSAKLEQDTHDKRSRIDVKPFV